MKPNPIGVAIALGIGGLFFAVLLFFSIFSQNALLFTVELVLGVAGALLMSRWKGKR